MQGSGLPFAEISSPIICRTAESVPEGTKDDKLIDYGLLSNNSITVCILISLSCGRGRRRQVTLSGAFLGWAVSGMHVRLIPCSDEEARGPGPWAAWLAGMMSHLWAINEGWGVSGDWRGHGQGAQLRFRATPPAGRVLREIDVRSH